MNKTFLRGGVICLALSIVIGIIAAIHLSARHREQGLRRTLELARQGHETKVFILRQRIAELQNTVEQCTAEQK